MTYSITDTLQQMALNPYDLTREGSLTPERIEQFTAESSGWRLLYGTERVDGGVMEALEALAREAKAKEKMDRMQAGEVMNRIEGYRSEERAVLHTALRDFFEDPNPDPRAAAATKLAKDEVEKLKLFLKETEGQFEEMVMIAIGGSDLGPKANYTALCQLFPNHRKVHFISNVDPDNAISVLSEVDLEKTLVVVVSKSGSTLETVTNASFARNYFEAAGCDPSRHFVAVTGKGSPMDDLTQYRQCFHIWDFVGGRYSTTSMVGGVMLSFAFGFDVYWELLRGAHSMDRTAREASLEKNLPLLSALLGVWNRNFLQYPTLAVIPYSEGLSRYPAHMQQVDMESNGKRIDRAGNEVAYNTGPIIWGEPGTNAQHSFFQLIHQGTSTIPVQFIGFKESQHGKDLEVQGTTSQEKLLSNLFAQSLALAGGRQNENPNKRFPGNRPSHILLAKKLTPFSLGALLAFAEHKAAFQGFIWNINSFDQEGVELGKVLAKRIIGRFAAKKGDKNAEEFPLGDALLNELEKL